MGEPITVTNVLTGETQTVYSERFAQRLKEEAKEARRAAIQELTDLHRLGAGRADDLIAIGIHTIEDMAEATVEELTEIEGVGDDLASEWIEQAKS